METTGIFTFRKIDEIAARQMVSWQYDAPYDTYSCAPGELEASVQWVLKPQYQYYTVWDENQELIGFRCFGEDAQVNGGDYSSEALDMGGGLAARLGRERSWSQLKLNARRQMPEPIFSVLDS